MAEDELPTDVAAWVESSTGGETLSARRHLAGASRQAWAVDVERDGSVLELFLLRDIGRGGGSERDAAVLTALATTDVPVPAVVGSDADMKVVLLERIEGESTFSAAEDDEEREATVGHLMEVTAALHRLDPSTPQLARLAHLGESGESPGPDHAGRQLASVERIATMIGDGLHPLFSCALAWLRRNPPVATSATALIHSDMGPGNLLHRDGRIVAVLDWEVAHWGDPMEDLAALAVRDMATRVGPLGPCFAEYERHGGGAVDLDTVDWYRILILTRNSMLIGLGLSFEDPEADRAQLMMYRTMLLRAAALVLCDVVGVVRPTEPPFAEAPITEEQRLVDHAWRDQRNTVEAALPDGVARQRAVGVSGVLGTVDHRLRFGADRSERELDDLEALLGERPESITAGLHDVGQLAEAADREAEVVAFLARHMLREAMLFEPLLGELADRHPQSLRDPR
jgi:aminoglycoside phosphotransferase (APT) family kinase protein